MNEKFWTTTEFSHECRIPIKRICEYVKIGKLVPQTYFTHNKLKGFLFPASEIEKIKNLRASFEKFCTGKITVKEAAKRLGCSVHHILNCRDRGHFTIHLWYGFPYPNKTLGLIDVDEFNDFRRRESEKLRRFYSARYGRKEFRDYFTTGQAAEFLNVPQSTILGQIKNFWLKDKSTGVVKTNKTQNSKKHGFCYLIPRPFVLKLENIRDEYLALRQNSLTVAEAMRILNYSKSPILSFIRTGKLRATKVLSWPSMINHYLISHEDLDAFLIRRQEEK